jgi:hypothetical protein
LFTSYIPSDTEELEERLKRNTIDLLEFLMWPTFEIFCSFIEPWLLVTKFVYEDF